MAASLRIFTVPPGRPFLRSLADCLLSGSLPVAGGARPGPLQLADTTLLLPTRRATRALQDAFLAASGGTALLLPHIKPIIGSAEEDFGALAGTDELAGDTQSELRPAIGDMERQLALANLVLRWSAARGGTHTPAQAANLARELARLMDAMEIEDVDPARMRSLVPETFASHWEETLRFLAIVTETWPKHLDDNGLVSKMRHDKLQVLEFARRLRTAPPAAPVIAAGVMSAVPAVTELLSAVTSLPNGALVLPGLDLTLDEESWNAIVPGHPEHPQFGVKKLLDALGARRQDVLPLPGQAADAPGLARAALVSEAMRPARTTARWHQYAAQARREGTARALSGVTILDAPSAEDEAEAIALILRQVAETRGRTAALVSPDRMLARRVAARLATWNIVVDDPVGQPLAKTPIGSFLDLVLQAASTRFEPVGLMTLLKHPFCTLGLDAEALARGRRALELAAFRTPYFGEGLSGVGKAVEMAAGDMRAGKRRHDAVRRLRPDDWQAARELVRRLVGALQPLEDVFGGRHALKLAVLVGAHVAAAEALGQPAAAGGLQLWGSDAGEQAAKLLAALSPEDLFAPDMTPADYPAFYRSLAEAVTVRRRAPAHPRVFIWEPYESRLQHPDVVILGSLNEGTWPQTADPGPWLNRPMRQSLGLPAPEERIGDAAHIFTALLGVERVYLTRAAKVDGAPTVPSRWLLRLQALLGGAGLAETDEPWLAWARQRNALAGPARPVRAPEPRPPLALRPRRLSATTIEKWVANPYAIFAQRILGLDALPALGRQPDAALRGQIVHDALGRFAQHFPNDLPADIRAELLGFARAGLEELSGSPRVAAFWLPRFERFAEWFAATERARRDGIGQTLAEVEGAVVVEGPAGPFTLTARADRIDVGNSGLVITDYKTAKVEDLAKRAAKGQAPQLPLEAAIALEGGFTGLAAAAVQALVYISASGGEPAGDQRRLDADAGQLATQAREGLIRLIAAFDDPAAPYRALRRARFTYRYDDYAHLARVAEWSVETLEEAA